MRSSGIQLVLAGVAFALVGLAAPDRAIAIEVRLLDHSLRAPLAGISADSHHLTVIDDGGGAGGGGSPWLPCALSVLIPGLGQIYNGQVLKGLGFMFGVSILSVVGQVLLTPNQDGSMSSTGGTGLVMLLFSAALTIYGWYDAYSVAASGGGAGEIEGPRRVIVLPETVAASDARDRKATALPTNVDVGLLALHF